MTKTRCSHRHRGLRRGALESLELLVGLPILILVALGTIHFGLLQSNLQSIAFASRCGAIKAAETSNLPTTNGAAVPEEVMSPIRDHLFSAGIENFDVHLEHNAGGSTVVLRSAVGSGTNCDPLPQLSGVPRPYVRAIICARLDELTPDITRVLGFSIAGPDNITRHASVMCYEIP